MTVSQSRLACSIKSAASLASWMVVAIVALFGLTFAIAWMVSLLRGGDPSRGDNVLVGLVCSLIALLFVGVFHLRKETVQLRVSNPDKFQLRMQKILEDLGYQWVHMTERHWHARPHFRSFLFGAGVTFKLEGNRAAITGPRLSLELIRRRYRMASHLDKVQQSITDSRNRVAETFLKRLELSLRLEAEHMEDFQKRISEVLAQHGTLLVDVQLMLISPDGMPESLWSREMKPWLEENKIHYEFHRDHTQRATIAATAGDGARADSFIDTCMWS